MNSVKNILTEEQLVSGLQKGDTEVFSCLYDQYSGALFGVIKRIIEDSDLAADILQDSFIKIWEKEIHTILLKEDSLLGCLILQGILL